MQILGNMLLREYANMMAFTMGPLHKIGTRKIRYASCGGRLKAVISHID